MARNQHSSYLSRYRQISIWLVVFAPIPGAILASAFNIGYNVVHIRPLLSEVQHQRFLETILIYNSIVYPFLILLWFLRVDSIRSVFEAMRRGANTDDTRRSSAQRRAVHLPWFFSALCATGWFLCVPVFLIALHTAPGSIDDRVSMHLPVSFLVAGLIHFSYGFFIVELATQKYLFPVLFKNTSPSELPGLVTLSVRRRGLLLTLTSGACPLVSVLLMDFAHDDFLLSEAWFGIAVAGAGIGIGLFCAALLGRLVARPIDALRRASTTVASGDLDVRIDMPRADEFGPLIDEFNHMVDEMRQKQKLRELFGAHVGQQAARQILARDPGLSGALEKVTVLFCDIRNFTARSASSAARDVVRVLNQFFEEMVHVVEVRHEGMVNKFLGDGFMAIFGIQECRRNPEDAAVLAATEMVERLEHLNRKLRNQGDGHLEIGIGVHSGAAIVGCIGSQHRMEFTAIGDAVNLASRLQDLTKELRTPVLLSRETVDELGEEHDLIELGDREVRGRPQAVRVYTLAQCVVPGSIEDAAS